MYINVSNGIISWLTSFFVMVNQIKNKPLNNILLIYSQYNNPTNIPKDGRQRLQRSYLKDLHIRTILQVWRQKANEQGRGDNVGYRAPPQIEFGLLGVVDCQSNLIAHGRFAKHLLADWGILAKPPRGHSGSPTPRSSCCLQ